MTKIDEEDVKYSASQLFGGERGVLELPTNHSIDGASLRRRAHIYESSWCRYGEPQILRHYPWETDS